MFPFQRQFINFEQRECNFSPVCTEVQFQFDTLLFKSESETNTFFKREFLSNSKLLKK